MAYTFLLNLYDEIDDRIKETQIELSSNQDDPEKLNALKGKIDILKEFKSFLTENLNRKLPKRIRKQLSKSWASELLGKYSEGQHPEELESTLEG